VSDLAIDAVRRTRAGDAWEARQSDASCGVPSSGEPAPVLLGLPTVRA
jgi:tRNA-2-methylthio-N6-dimethylallyladenosine synthase